MDVEYVAEHFSPEDDEMAQGGPMLSDGLWQSIDFMLEHCPVAPTDRQFFGLPDGGWIVSTYKDVMEVIGTPEVYSSKTRRGTGDETPLIPMDLDPPESLEYRRLLAPYFTVKSAKPFEPLAREIIVRLIDKVADAGRCDDWVAEVAQPFASDIQWGWLVGLDSFDHDQVLDWVLTWTYEHFTPKYEQVEREWVAWTEDVITRRRSEPRRDDLVDALIHTEVGGRMLTDSELTGIMMIMIVGGVTTTSDAIGNIMLRLAVDPELQETLRADPSLWPSAIEEFMRVDSPALGPTRRCTRDTEVGGQALKKGDQLFVHLAAANRDPAMFDDPTRLDIRRARNPHVAFGAGHHRCLGATFARQNLRIVFEEILARLDDIRLVEDDLPSRKAGVVWGMARLPVAFTRA